MAKNNKLKNTREVTFSEDYNPSKSVPIYSKGETAYIHKDNLENLKKGGAKFSSKELNVEDLIDKAARDFEESKKPKK